MADKRIQYNERMTGAGHPTLPDTLNRLVTVEHNTDGTHDTTKVAPASKGVTNGDLHDHSGGDGATLDHTNLLNKGTNTHAQIDTALTRLANTSGTNTGDQDLSGYVRTTTDQTVAGTKAFTDRVLVDTTSDSSNAVLVLNPTQTFTARSPLVTGKGFKIHNTVVGGSTATQINHIGTLVDSTANTNSLTVDSEVNGSSASQGGTSSIGVTNLLTGNFTSSANHVAVSASTQIYNGTINGAAIGIFGQATYNTSAIGTNTAANIIGVSGGSYNQKSGATVSSQEGIRSTTGQASAVSGANITNLFGVRTFMQPYAATITAAYGYDLEIYGAQTGTIGTFYQLMLNTPTLTATTKYGIYQTDTNAPNYFGSDMGLAKNLNFTGTGNRITGDFSNATIADRVMFQTSTPNAGTSMYSLPNGTSTAATYQVLNSSDPNNTARGLLGINSSLAYVASQVSGTGTQLPLSMRMATTDHLLLSTNGNIVVKTAVAQADDAGSAKLQTFGGILERGGSGIGYGVGSGGQVTQLTSRTTGVTLNKPSGAITLFSAAGTATWQSFIVTNSLVAVGDVVYACQQAGTDKYMVFVTNVSSGSFVITFATTGGTTTEQPVFNFSVVKGSYT